MGEYHIETMRPSAAALEAKNARIRELELTVEKLECDYDIILKEHLAVPQLMEARVKRIEELEGLVREFRKNVTPPCEWPCRCCEYKRESLRLVPEPGDDEGDG